MSALIRGVTYQLSLLFFMAVGNVIGSDRGSVLPLIIGCLVGFAFWIRGAVLLESWTQRTGQSQEVSLDEIPPLETDDLVVWIERALVEHRSKNPSPRMQALDAESQRIFPYLTVSERDAVRRAFQRHGEAMDLGPYTARAERRMANPEEWCMAIEREALYERPARPHSYTIYT